jgi:hypothetical protein
MDNSRHYTVAAQVVDTLANDSPLIQFYGRINISH